ncbi:MAG: hypothetical protein WC807_16585 [Hyphomicrobium sp.]|jgi:hypothetical protein
MRKVLTFTEEELAWIKKNARRVRRRAHAAFCQTFERTDVSLSNFNTLCKRNGWMTGRTGHYKKGSIPATKGKKMPYNANRARTQFKKGQTPHNTKYLGHERVSVDGYVETSIDKVNPHTGFLRRYVLKHKYLWEKQNGPVPEDMCLKCLDANRLNTDPSNWEPIPRGALPFLNGHRGPNYNAAAEQVRPAILTLAKLKYTRGQKARGKPASSSLPSNH